MLKSIMVPNDEPRWVQIEKTPSGKFEMTSTVEGIDGYIVYNTLVAVVNHLFDHIAQKFLSHDGYAIVSRAGMLEYLAGEE